MASAESQSFAALMDEFYDDPEQLSQLLRQRAGPHDRPPQFTVSTTSDPSPAKPPTTASPQRKTPPRVAAAPPHTRRQQTRHARPGLPTHQSAPTSTGTATEMEGAVRTVQSFVDPMDRPGDTQPDSQIYRNFTSGLLGTANNDATGSSPEGVNQEMTSPALFLEDDPSTQLHAEPPPTSPLKFETPALAGRKRDSQGQVVTLSSAARTVTTPGTALTAAAFFPSGVGNGEGGNGMSLTQIFNATQARTSPIVGAPDEDDVFQRPSPDFATMRHSSPLHNTMSSPIKPVQSDPRLRSSSEPRVEYVTMKQSQENRLHQTNGEHFVVMQQDSWETPGEAERRIAKRMAREKLEREAGRSLRVVTAPAAASPRRKQGRTLLSAISTPKAISFAGVKASRRSAYDGPFDSDEEDELGCPEPVNAHGAEGDSLDKISQDIITSVKPTPAQLKTDFKIQVPNTSSHPQRTLSGRSTRASPITSPAARQQRTSLSQLSAYPPQGHQPKSSRESVIMDSQPDANAHSKSPPLPKPLLLPSSPSTNEYSINQTTLGKTGFTSQIVSSSMPPMPPKSSSPELGDPRRRLPNSQGDRDVGVPSSPPALAEDDLTYDEHDYGEHHSTNGDEVPELDHSVHDDHPMEEMGPLISEEDDLIRSTHPAESTENKNDTPTAQSRLNRHSTIPESDLTGDTQPSAFQQYTHIRNDTAQSDANQSTGPFHTARENQSTVHNDSTHASEHAGTVTPGLETPARNMSPHFRSLNDIANQPATQISNEPADVEIPQLSFSTSMDDEMNLFSPAHKRTRITYSAKRKVFSSPTAEDHLSSSSPSKPVRQMTEGSASSLPNAIIVPSRKSVAKLRKSPSVVIGAKATLKVANNSLVRNTSPSTPSKRKSTSAMASLAPPEAVTDDVDNGAKAARKSVESIKAQETSSQMPSGKLLVPNRVIAHWPGLGFFPATYIGRADFRHLHIRYDDGTTNSMDPAQVKAFELRIGDQVKVDRAGMKKHIYLVIGFKDRLGLEYDEEFPLSDRFGNMAIVLEAKQRDSLSHPQANMEQETITVPMTEIYFTNSLWGKLHDRIFDHLDASALSGSASRVATPVSERPTSPIKSRRGPAGPSVLKQTLRLGSATPSDRSGNGLVFSNMVFAVTLGPDFDERDSIMYQITSNGGVVLDGGFDDLFQIGTADGADVLAIKDNWQDLRFVALISDAQSRRTKYIQALALNLPCLHHRWLVDSIAASKPLSFSPYLLPAGISTYLDPRGVVRSRTMTTYDPSADNAPAFSDVVESRVVLLEGQSVLLITGKTKKEREQKTPYQFLTYALGPSKIGRCNDIDAALDMVRIDHWDWIYVGEGADAVADAESVFFGKPTGSFSKKSVVKGKRRKREEANYEPLISIGYVDGTKVRLVRDEFVLQSLILGALVEA